MRKRIDWRIMRKKVDWKDVGRRAGKTFVQAFVAAVVLNGEQIAGVRDWESARAVLAPVLVGGLAAGVSAVWNFLTGCYEKFDGFSKEE